MSCPGQYDKYYNREQYIDTIYKELHKGGQE